MKRILKLTSISLLLIIFLSCALAEAAAPPAKRIKPSYGEKYDDPCIGVNENQCNKEEFCWFQDETKKQFEEGKCKWLSILDEPKCVCGFLQPPPPPAGVLPPGAIPFPPGQDPPPLINPCIGKNQIQCTSDIKCLVRNDDERYDLPGHCAFFDRGVGCQCITDEDDPDDDAQVLPVTTPIQIPQETVPLQPTSETTLTKPVAEVAQPQITPLPDTIH